MKKKEILVVEPIEREVVELVEPTVIVEPTIYDKFKKYTAEARSGYLTGLNYRDAMEILRYCENIMGINIPMNMSCGSCMLDLMKLFMRLEGK